MTRGASVLAGVEPVPERQADRAPARVAARRPAPARAWGTALRACRPRQWVKNSLVAIAPASAGVLTRPGVMAAVFAAVVAFCMLSSATYLLNDVRDRDQDRLHPRKRERPIAAGLLSVRRAKRLAAALAVLAVALCAAVEPGLALVGCCYLALTTSYSLWWRRIVVADIVAVAGGFVLRAIAGGAAAGVPLSWSFLAVTSACALFLVAGKRYAELGQGSARVARRVTLGRYSRRALRQGLTGAAMLGALAYGRWAFARPDLGPWLELSMVPFVLWLARYRLLLDAGAGEAPEELILGDPVLIGLGAVWIVLFIGGVYGPQ